MTSAQLDATLNELLALPHGMYKNGGLPREVGT